MLTKKLESEEKLQNIKLQKNSSFDKEETIISETEEEAPDFLKQTSESSFRSRVSLFSKRAPVTEFVQTDENRITKILLDQRFSKDTSGLDILDDSESDSDVSINSAI